MYLDHNVIFLKLVGMYQPDNEKYLGRYKLWSILVIIFVATGVSSGLADVYVSKKGLIDASTNILTSAIYFAAWCRIIYFQFYGYRMKRTVKMIDDGFKFETDNGIFDENMKSYLKVAKILSYYWLMQAALSGQFTIFLSLFTNTDEKRELPVHSWYPWNFWDSPFFEFTFILQSITMILVTTSVVVFDGLYASIALLLSGQFRLLGISFRNIIFTSLLKCDVPLEIVLKFSKDFNSNISSSIRNEGLFENVEEINPELLSNREYNKLLNIINTDKYNRVFNDLITKYIEEHKKLLRIFVDCENFFAPIILPMLVCTLFYLVFVAFVVITVNIMSQIYLVPYLFNCFVQLLIWTYFGQILTDRCEDSRRLFDEMPWYLCNQQQKRTLQIIEMKLQKVLRFTAGNYFDMSLMNYIAILRASFSYITVLKNVSV